MQSVLMIFLKDFERFADAWESRQNPDFKQIEFDLLKMKQEQMHLQSFLQN